MVEKKGLIHQIGDYVNNRYRILGVLGQGGIGTTYQAEDILTGVLVALKVLSIRYLKHAKVMELFEREARILSRLEHPGIPRYLDYFQSEQSGCQGFYIVQQLVDGKSLSVLVEEGWKPDETEVRQIAEQILRILVYLQQLTPPIIHRDIKPQNIIRNLEGELFLVDFGAVQDTYHQTQTGGSTIIGTYGYMAPEQYVRQATLSTDLFGLGQTLVFLLTQSHPASFPPSQVNDGLPALTYLSQSFAQWVRYLIHPNPSQRYPSARHALALLHVESIHFYQSNDRHKWFSNQTKLLSSAEKLTITISISILNIKFLGYFATLVGIALTPLFISWFVFFLLLISWPSWPIAFQIIRGERLNHLLTAWGVLVITLIFKVVLSALCKTSIIITNDNFILKRFIFNHCFQTFRGLTEDLQRVDLRSLKASLLRFSVPVCILRTTHHQYRFGAFLSHPERVWIVGEIRKFIFQKRMSTYQNSSTFMQEWETEQVAHSTTYEQRSSQVEEIRGTPMSFPQLNTSREEIVFVLKRSTRNTFLAKLILITTLTVILSYVRVQQAITDYQKGRDLTKEEYIEDYDQYKTELLSEKNYASNQMLITLVYLIFITLVIGAYELLAVLIGLLVGKFFKD